MSLEAQEKQDSLAHSKVIHPPAQKASQIHLLCIANDGDRRVSQRTVHINKIESLVQCFGIWQGESEPHVSKVQLLPRVKSNSGVAVNILYCENFAVCD